jgi:hypothetical protein
MATLVSTNSPIGNIRPPLPSTPQDATTPLRRRERVTSRARPALEKSHTAPLALEGSPETVPPLPVRIPRRRPRVPQIVTDVNNPVISDVPETPKTTSHDTYTLRKRPTLSDLVAQLEASKAAGATSGNVPPVPALLPQFSRESTGGTDSRISSVLNRTSGPLVTPVATNPDGVYASSSPMGNAFTPDGFWGSQGRRFSAKPADVREEEDSDEDEDKTPESTDATVGKAKHEKQESTDTTTSETKGVKRERTNTITSEAKTFGTPRSGSGLRKVASAGSASVARTIASMGSDNVGSVFAIDVDMRPQSDRFSVDQFLKELGLQLTKSQDNSHPFPEFDVLENDPVAKEAYDQVHAALVGYWFSKFKNEGGNKGGDPVTKTSAQLTSGQAMESPRSKSTKDLFRHFGKKISKELVDPLLAGSSADLVMSPDKGKRKEEPPATDKTTEHAVEVTHTILTSLLSQFNDRGYSDISKYRDRKPERISHQIELLDRAEKLWRKCYTISSPEILAEISRWSFLTDPQSAAETSRLDKHISDTWDTTQGEYETILDRQRSSLIKTHNRSKSVELRVPEAGHRIIWATKYASWALDLLQKEMEKQQATELKTDNVPSATASELSDMDEKEDPNYDLTYAEMLNTIEEELGYTATDSGDEGSKTPTAMVSAQLSPDEKKERRRKTTFNMGLITPEGPSSPVSPKSPRDTNIKLRKMRAMEEEKVDWEMQLNAAVDREKARQRMKGKAVDEQDKHDEQDEHGNDDWMN